MPNIQFQLRRGTASTWTSTNPTLANGEFGFETDTRQLKIGNGVSWNSLPYIQIGQAANWSTFPAYQTVDMSGNILNNVGSIRNGAGTVSAPSYTFLNDVSMGLYDPSTNMLGIVTSGVERARFDATGDFGIATTAPRSGVLSNAQNTSIPALDVSGQMYARLPVYIQSTTSVDLNTNYNAFLNSYFFITNSGFNAITLPTATLTTQGGAFFQFKNSTSSFLSITLTNTLGLSSPVAISPSNAITFVVSPSNADTMLLF